VGELELVGRMLEVVSLVGMAVELMVSLFEHRWLTFFERRIVSLPQCTPHLENFVLFWKVFLLVLMHFLSRPLVPRIDLGLMVLQF